MMNSKSKMTKEEMMKQEMMKQKMAQKKIGGAVKSGKKYAKGGKVRGAGAATKGIKTAKIV